MPSRLIDGLVTTDALTRAFSDEALLRAMLAFESALARAGATCGVIPADAVAAVEEAATSVDFDADDLLRGMRSNGTLAIPVVGALTRRVHAIDPAAARWVHWGATSQDVHDTAMVLCLRSAWDHIEADHLRLISALESLAVRHAGSVMLGRTLLQPAVPTTFGLKAAGWLGAVTRAWRPWSEAFGRTQVIQFGGAAGTLAAFGDQGVAVEQALAARLDLGVPDAPWHAHRDRPATFVAAAGVYTAALGKMARDIALLMQHEVGEAFEAGGGSSTMPHKRNPAGCAAVMACAHRLPALVSTMLGAMVQEHERGVGGWHAEAATIRDATQAAGAAVSAMAVVIENLTVDEARMRRNIEDTRGVIFAERIVLATAPALGRAHAADLVKAAVKSAEATGRSLAATVAESPELSKALAASGQTAMFDASAYQGSAEIFRARLLTAALPGPRKH